ncbi:MAG: ABC transporter substrate-binding protein [Planctomycetota bacterium]
MKADVVNGALLVLALAAATWAATLPGSPGIPIAGRRSAVADAPEAGATEVVDARGIAVPVGSYERIVSLSTISDHVLLRMVEPDRLVSITGFTARDHPEAWRFGARPSIDASGDVEAVIALRPDLVIVSKFADESYMERLRERDIQVFDLGEMRGVRTTRANVRALGALLDLRERAEKVEGAYARQLQALDDAVPDEDMAPGIYLSIYGDSLFGATANTSYADTLFYGGVRDIAAERGFVDWPQYSAEQLIRLDPPLIVTLRGMADVLRSHSVLSGLRACGPGGRIVEIDRAYNADAGLGIVEAAQAVQDLVHGEGRDR